MKWKVYLAIQSSHSSSLSFIREILLHSETFQGVFLHEEQSVDGLLRGNQRGHAHTHTHTNTRRATRKRTSFAPPDEDEEVEVEEMFDDIEFSEFSTEFCRESLPRSVFVRVESCLDGLLERDASAVGEGDGDALPERDATEFGGGERIELLGKVV